MTFVKSLATALLVVSCMAPSTHAVEWIGTVALVVILFDGGASIGLRRFRTVALPVAALGTVGTFATAGLVALFAHCVAALLAGLTRLGMAALLARRLAALAAATPLPGSICSSGRPPGRSNCSPA